MREIKNKTHTKETFYYAFSCMLERASFYGLRAVLVLYMLGETLNMERDEALTIYGWLVLSLLISKIIGALFGDLLLGNKKAIIIGGIIQAIGAFSLCIPSTTGLYLGLSLVVFGSGLFSPNITANFGKTYVTKTKLLDSAYTIFYLAINLGSFLGVLFISYLGETFSYTIGFLISGILMLFSLIPFLILKEETSVRIQEQQLEVKFSVLKVLSTLFIIGLFWVFYDISNIRSIDLQFQISEISSLVISKYLWQVIKSIFVLPISIIAILLWTKTYSSQLYKLTLGCIFGVISFGILLLIPKAPQEDYTVTYLISLFFLGISEIHIAPIINSVLTQYTNPKYLAIAISLSVFPTRLFYSVLTLFNDTFYENPILGLQYGVTGMTFLALALIGYLLWNKRNTIYKLN